MFCLWFAKVCMKIVVWLFAVRWTLPPRSWLTITSCLNRKFFPWKRPKSRLYWRFQNCVTAAMSISGSMTFIPRCLCIRSSQNLMVRISADSKIPMAFIFLWPLRKKPSLPRGRGLCLIYGQNQVRQIQNRRSASYATSPLGNGLWAAAFTWMTSKQPLLPSATKC